MIQSPNNINQYATSARLTEDVLFEDPTRCSKIKVNGNKKIRN